MLPINQQHRLRLDDISPIQSDTEDDYEAEVAVVHARALQPPSITFQDVDTIPVSFHHRSPGLGMTASRLGSRQPSPRSANNPFGNHGRDHFPSLDIWLEEHGHDASSDLGARPEEDFQAQFEWSIDGKASLVRARHLHDSVCPQSGAFAAVPS
jgi:hypothetical protein